MKEKGQYDPIGHQKRLFRWSWFTLICIVTAILSNELRTPPPIAHYNIGFNWGVFFPLLFVSILISYFVLGHTIIGWRRMPNSRMKLFNIIISMLVFMYVIFLFIA